MRHTLALLFFPAFLSALTYDVTFLGLDDSACVKALKNTSDLVLLQDRPPASVNGLRYRAESDLPGLLRVLQAYAYYDASVTYDIASENDRANVYLLIRPGQQYTLASYQVFHGTCKEPANITGCFPFSPERLGLQINKPPLSFDIVNAEFQVLTELSRCGYPLASIEKRKVEVDLAKKEVSAAVCIEEGPQAKFGPTKMHGLEHIHPRYIERRIAWKEGTIYDSDLVEETQKRLLKTGLFTSAMVTHDQEIDTIGELPMTMRLTEAKHRQLTLGVFYGTVDGFGGSFAWTHRNLRGMGEILTIDGQFSQWWLLGKITFKKPDFLIPDQAYRALAAVYRESINPYVAFSYRFANYVERPFNTKDSFSVGLKIDHIHVFDSATNGTYLLIGLPVFVKHDKSDSVLDPTRGYSLIYSITPYQSMFHSNQHFFKQRFTATWYLPVTSSRVLVLAFRAQFGSIAAAHQANVPLPKLFLGGSENELRGYRYKTVSPLNSNNEPLGGRSAIYFSFEPRIRFSKTIGVVPFADFGTVTSEQFPQFNTKWYKSVGVGVRYFAFFGPLRFDVGFPLDRRKGIDEWYRIYATVGQTF
ncbi:MAG: outer membrane protein assembly factor [Verrucomicrobiota bacterium]|nr:outer membrane protein assembly factor [Verrucomicrobiota bacterium]